MNIELKPCPFCGGEAEMMGDQYPYVECQECTVNFSANHSYEFDEGDAARKWNARSAAGDSARAQSGQGAEVAADFRAEIRTERDPSDEYVSYLTLIADGKSHPYLHIPESLDQSVLGEALRRLNAQPQPAVPERWKDVIDRIVPDISPEPDQNEYPAEWSVWADRQRIRRELSLLSTPQPEGDGWITVPERAMEYLKDQWPGAYARFYEKANDLKRPQPPKQEGDQ